MYESSKELAHVWGVNHKKVIMPLLFGSLMGKKQGLPLFDSAAILGKDQVRARFLESIQFCGGLSKKQQSSLQKAWKAKDCSELGF